MKQVFSDISGQDAVTGYLQGALDSGRVTHAYLLAGSQGSGKLEVALRFASALIAGDDAAQYDQALRRVHPDLHLLEPGSASGYLVDQIRELVHDAELAPIRSSRKVYIVDRSEKLSSAPANAFLKTLEEPPADVTCILLATSEQGVLETLRSRCEVLVLNEVVRFHEGNFDVLDTMRELSSNCGNRTLLACAKRIVEASKSGSEELAAQQAEEVEKAKDYLSAGAKKELEKRQKRELSAKERAALVESLAVARTWLRDCLLTQQGSPELISYTECAAQTMGAATTASERGLLDALKAVQDASVRISYNVTPQLAVEAMCIEIREALCRQ